MQVRVAMSEIEDNSGMEKLFDISLTYRGGIDADKSHIDLYDLAMALNGFHRSLAITSHFLFHDEIITRAPFAKGIRIISEPSKKGSYEILAYVGVVFPIAIAALYKFGTAPKDTPIGHLASSLYELAIYKCLGKPLDYSKTLFGDTIAEHYERSQIESLSQKLESAVINMHRPIRTQSALESSIAIGQDNIVTFDGQTLDLMKKLTIEADPQQFEGRVAGYSANTRSGMIYTSEERRAIPFELERGTDIDSSILSQSLGLYDAVKSKRMVEDNCGFFRFLAKKVTNQAGTTKKYYITHIYSNSLKYEK